MMSNEQTGGGPDTTEDSIFASIEAAEEGMPSIPYGSEPTDAEVTTLEPEAPSTPEAQPGAAEPAPTQPKADEGSKDDKSKEQQAGTKEGDRDTQPRTDDKGNLVDPRTGEIVAGAGAERRVYERANQLRAENEKLTGMLRQQAATIDQLNTLNGMPAKLGLNPGDVDLGLKVVAQFKTNPVEAARFVLQEAMRLGHNLKDIIGAEGADGTSSLDMGAVAKLIDDRLAPITQDRQARERQEQDAAIEQQAQAAYSSFLDGHPHAELHQDAIARLMQARDIPPEQAYWQLRAWATEKGYDFTQPLAAQMQAGTSESGTTGTAETQGNAPTGAPKPTATQPIPTGTGSTTMTPKDAHVNEVGVDPDADYDDIVLQAMREAGMSPIQ